MTADDNKQVEKAINIALVGNPNVGKSLIFNFLTGVYADVSNYPGTTIEVSSASLDNNAAQSKYNFNIIDTPGVYSISSFNDEERVTRDYVLDADIIINVVSAASLSRDLFLSKQLTDMGKPMLMILNQIDYAKKKNITINVDTISQILGVDILECSALKNKGLNKIKETISNFADNAKIKPGRISKKIDHFVAPIQELVFDRAEAVLIAEGDKTVASRNRIELQGDFSTRQQEIYEIRRKEVNDLIDGNISDPTSSLSDWISAQLLNPITGTIFGVAILYLFLYLFLGVFVAGNIVDFIETNIFNAYYEPLVRDLVGRIFPIDASSMSNLLFTKPLTAIGTFLAGDYGVLTLTITYLYALLAPLVFGFYFGLAILEDSGYLPRLAVLVDGVLSRLGMNGRAIIPLILGGGCVTMATVTTRLLSSDKAKIITMALLGLTIPCSAQLGVIQGLLSQLGGPLPWLVWGGTLTAVFIATGAVMNKLMPGGCESFISDIPPLRLPEGKNVLQKTLNRSKIFLDEATPAFFVAAALVSSLQVTGILQKIIEWSEPVLSSTLLLPKEVALSFILGMVRRDFGAFGLMDISMTASQLVVTCVVLTLFVPCIATVAVMIKEKNLKTAGAIWLSSWILAFGVGAILARLLPNFL